MWRPRSDIGTLQARDVHFKYSEIHCLEGVTLHIRAPKEAQTKNTVLGVLQDQFMCPVNTLHLFMNRSKDCRLSLQEDHTVFLAYISNSDQVRSIQPTTVANILKAMMTEADIDTKLFKPHSIRSASSTKAVQLDRRVEDVKKHANWSLSADTFERYYFKPAYQDRTSSKIMTSIFSDTASNTTSEVEMEATKIGLAATSN